MKQWYWKYLGSWLLMAALVSACQPITEVRLTPTTDSPPNAIAYKGSTATLLPSSTPLLIASPTISPTHGPTRTPQLAPELAWIYEAGGAIWGSPAIDRSVIYFGSDDGCLYAVDLQTRRLRWKFPTGDLVRSHPAIWNRIVYFSSDDGFLYALDADSGAEKWRADIGSASMPSRGDLTREWDYQQSSPVVVDDTVYVGSGAGAIYAIDAATGAQIWIFATVGPVRDTPAVAGETVFAGDKLAILHALDADSGVEKWRAQGCDIPSPLVVDGIVYCGSRGPTDLRAWDAGTGELLWKFSYQGSWVESSPRISDGTLFIGSSDATALFAIDPKTGAQKWKFSTGDYAWSTPAISKQVVYIGSYSILKSVGKFYAVDAATGEPIWVLSVPKGIVSSPVVENEVVYFGGLDGKLYAISAVP
ncbi:MAG: PQQ-binding-like beta-propeller repeat protein [Anaerolineaceae bacterium]